MEALSSPTAKIFERKTLRMGVEETALGAGENEALSCDSGGQGTFHARHAGIEYARIPGRRKAALYGFRKSVQRVLLIVSFSVVAIDRPSTEDAHILVDTDDSVTVGETDEERKFDSQKE